MNPVSTLSLPTIFIFGLPSQIPMDILPYYFESKIWNNFPISYTCGKCWGHMLVRHLSSLIIQEFHYMTLRCSRKHVGISPPSSLGHLTFQARSQGHELRTLHLVNLLIIDFSSASCHFLGLEPSIIQFVYIVRDWFYSESYCEMKTI